jgi:hypothetical protein
VSGHGLSGDVIWLLGFEWRVWPDTRPDRGRS